MNSDSQHALERRKQHIWTFGQDCIPEANMTNLRVAHFSKPQEFLDAIKVYDDSFMNLTLGSLLDSLDPTRAKDRTATYRTLLGVYKGDKLIITLSKVADDFVWTLATPGGVEELSPEDVSDAFAMLVVLLHKVIDPKLVDSVLGPTGLVNSFIETWVDYVQALGLRLKASEPLFKSQATFATLATIPPLSPTPAQYRISMAQTEADADAVAPLAVDFTNHGPRKTTLEGAKRTMCSAVQMKQLWLCHVGEQIAGYCLVGRATPRTIAIRNVYVTPAQRRKGIAEVMVRALTRFYLGAEPLSFEGAPSSKPDIGVREEICLNVAEEAVARLYKRCGFLSAPEDREPVTGRKGLCDFMLRSVEVL